MKKLISMSLLVLGTIAFANNNNLYLNKSKTSSEVYSNTNQNKNYLLQVFEENRMSGDKVYYYNNTSCMTYMEAENLAHSVMTQNGKILDYTITLISDCTN